MRMVAVVVVALAATARAMSVPAWDGRAARVQDRVRVSLSANGPWLPEVASHALFIEVHEESGDRIQLVEHTGSVDVTLYIERAALRQVALADAVLYPSVAAAKQLFDAHAPRIRLAQGTPLDSVTPAEQGLAHVRSKISVGSSRLEISGYVAVSAIGLFYDANRGEAIEASVDETMVDGPFALRASPGGEVFARSGGGPAKILRRDEAWALVYIGGRVFGWVEAKKLSRLSSGADTLRGIGTGTPRQPPPPDTLPPGTALYDAVAGREVARVVMDFKDPPVKATGEWLQFDVRTSFGKIALWARRSEAVLRPGNEGSGAVARDRVVIEPVLRRAGGPLTAEEIDGAIKARAGTFRACFQKALAQVPTLRGKLVVHFRIGGMVSYSRRIPRSRKAARCATTWSRHA